MRSRVRGVCPKCGHRFTELKKIGFLCLECKAVPSRFCIDLSWNGDRIRIYSDKTGQVLDLYQRASTVHAHLNYEIDNHIFEPEKYMRVEAAKFYASNLLDRFEQDKIPKVAPSYKKDYRRMVHIAKAFFKNQDVREIRKVDIINYQAYCEEKFTWKEKTLKNNMDLFKVFMNYLQADLEIIDKVPQFPDIEVPEPKISWLHSKDQIALYELVADDDKPIVGFLMLHGCRPGEARALKCKDVDPETQSINCRATFSKNVYREKRKGKKAKAYVLAIHPEMLDFITGRVRSSHPEAFLFVNVNTGGPYTQEAILRVWGNVRRKANITNGLRLYDATRHSLASQLANQNIPLNKISQLLGHSTAKMSEKYTHHDLESLRIDLSKMSLKRKTVSELSLKKKDDDK